MRWLIAVMVTLTLWAPQAWSKPEDTKPHLTLHVYKGKQKLGKESVRFQRGESNSYLSTTARLKERGRTYGFRTHMVFDAKNKLLTYDRWIDVRGASPRRRVYAFKGAWKMVIFGGPTRKRTLTDLGIKQPPAVLEPRSPALVAQLVSRLSGEPSASVPWVHAEKGQAGTLRLSVVPSTAADGSKYTQLILQGTLKSKPIELKVIQDAKGKVVEVHGLDGYSGRTRAKPIGPLTAAPAAQDGDAPVAPPADDKAKATDKGAAGAAPADSAPADQKKASPKPQSPAAKK